MNHKRINRSSRVESELADSASPSHLPPVELPKPVLDRRKSVVSALQKRRTTREILDKKVPLQVLSNLLWAAWGVNRSKGPFGIPGRTAASASNSQEIDVYLSLEEGIYFFEAVHHVLIPVTAGDFRALTIGPGQASLVAKAPVHLIYVANVYRLSHTLGYQEPGLKDPDIQKSYYFVDTGLIAGNVYLFAASMGLASWFHNCNKPALAAKLKLRAVERVLFAQTVGYPARK